MKKFAALFTVLAICTIIGGSVFNIGNSSNPVAEHGVAPGTEAITAL